VQLSHLLLRLRPRASKPPLLLWRALQGPHWPLHLRALQQLVLLVLHLHVRLLVQLLAPPLLDVLVVLQQRGLPQLRQLLLVHGHARGLARLLRQLPPFRLMALKGARFKTRLQSSRNSATFFFLFFSPLFF